MINYGTQAVQRAQELKNYKYWYGGKGQVASVSLAKQLKAQNPSVWTDSYYQKAIKDVDGTTRVGDCSYLVCYAYNISQIGSYQIAESFDEYNGDPENGMVLWRPGHVGIYNKGKVIELKGIDYDYMDSNDYKKDEWKKILRNKVVKYGTSDELAEGWHFWTAGPWYRHSVGTGVDTYYHDMEASMFAGSNIEVVPHFNESGYVDSIKLKEKDGKTFKYILEE